MSLRYAISGMSGFIGTAIRRRLEADGNEVTGIPRLLLPDVNKLWKFFDSIKPDGIIHLAAYGNHYSQTDPERILYSNVILTLNVFKAAAGRPVYNFSTSAVHLPKQTFYSVSKRCTEELAKLFPNTVNVRPYSVYGPGEAPFRFIPTVINALQTGREITLDEYAVHDWIYIDDFVTAFLNWETEIGSGTQYSNLQVVRRLEALSKTQLNYIPGKVRSYDTGSWKCPAGVPGRSFEVGLMETYKYYTE